MPKTTIERELAEYARIKLELYKIKGFGGLSIDAAVKYATMDMINELKHITDKEAYLHSENEYLCRYLDKKKTERG